MSDEELAEGRTLVQELLEEVTFRSPAAPLPLDQAPPAPHALPCPPARPNKRKVAQSLENEEDVYLDIKKLYVFDKVCWLTKRYCLHNCDDL